MMSNKRKCVKVCKCRRSDCSTFDYNTQCIVWAKITDLVVENAHFARVCNVRLALLRFEDGIR